MSKCHNNYSIVHQSLVPAGPGSAIGAIGITIPANAGSLENKKHKDKRLMQI